MTSQAQRNRTLPNNPHPPVCPVTTPAHTVRDDLEQIEIVYNLSKKINKPPDFVQGRPTLSKVDIDKGGLDFL